MSSWSQRKIVSIGRKALLVVYLVWPIRATSHTFFPFSIFKLNRLLPPLPPPHGRQRFLECEAHLPFMRHFRAEACRMLAPACGDLNPDVFTQFSVDQLEAFRSENLCVDWFQRLVGELVPAAGLDLLLKTGSYSVSCGDVAKVARKNGLNMSLLGLLEEFMSVLVLRDSPLHVFLSAASSLKRVHSHAAGLYVHVEPSLGVAACRRIV